jgi:uncharacterized damage-inducible protein DinB
MREFFIEMFDYNRYANNLYIDVIGNNNFSNLIINKLFSHIHNVHDLWLSRLGKRKPHFGIWDIHDNDSLFDMNQQLYIETIAFLKSFSDGDLDGKITYLSSSGETFENSSKEGLMQLINHGTHHRSQISLILRQLGLEPPKSDYLYYLRGEK